MRPCVILFTLGIWSSVVGQSRKLICHTQPGPGEVNDPSKIYAISVDAEMMLQDELDDLSIEEASQQIIDIAVDIAYTLMTENLVLNDNGDLVTPPGEVLNLDELTLGIFKAALNLTEGVEILQLTFSEPSNLILLVQKTVSLFNESCLDDTLLFGQRYVVEILQAFLVEPFRENVIDLMVATAVISAKNRNVTEAYLEATTSAVNALEEAKTLSGILPLVSEISLEDLLSGVLSEFGEDMGITNQEATIFLFNSFLENLQAAFSLDDTDFVDFLIEIFKRIQNMLMN